jgi:hypothetical protein
MSLDKFPILFVMIITRQITRTSLDAGVADSVAVEHLSRQDTGDESSKKKKAALLSRSQRGKGGREDLREGDARRVLGLRQDAR